jgi:hypothetical protein
VYAGLEVIGMPPTAKTKGILTAYRLISALRYTPATSTYGLKVGQAKAITRSGTRRFVLPVTSTGNTVTPVSGTVRVKGPLGTRQGSVIAAKVLPGKSIQLGLLPANPPKGTYTATVTLKQGTLRANVTRKVVVKR